MLHTVSFPIFLRHLPPSHLRWDMLLLQIHQCNFVNVNSMLPSSLELVNFKIPIAVIQLKILEIKQVRRKTAHGQESENMQISLFHGPLGHYIISKSLLLVLQFPQFLI